MSRDEQRRRGPCKSLATTGSPGSNTDSGEHNGLTAFIVDRFAELGCKPRRFEYHEVTGWTATCPIYEPRFPDRVPEEWALHPRVCVYITIREPEDGQALIRAFPCDGCSLGDIVARLLGVTEDDPAVWKAAREGGAT